jgi:hypothetical protein
MRIIYVTFKKKNWTQVDAIYVIAIDQTDHYNSGVDYFNVDRFVANSARIDSFCFDLKFPKRKISKALIRYGGFFDRLGQCVLAIN